MCVSHFQDPECKLPEPSLWEHSSDRERISSSICKYLHSSSVNDNTQITESFWQPECLNIHHKWHILIVCLCKSMISPTVVSSLYTASHYKEPWTQLNVFVDDWVSENWPLKPTADGQKKVLGTKFQSVNLQNWRFIAIDRCRIDLFFFVCVCVWGKEERFWASCPLTNFQRKQDVKSVTCCWWNCAVALFV